MSINDVSFVFATDHRKFQQPSETFKTVRRSDQQSAGSVGTMPEWAEIHFEPGGHFPFLTHALPFLDK
jgi:hypothetical protein